MGENRGYIGIMEKKMETTISDLGLGFTLGHLAPQGIGLSVLLLKGALWLVFSVLFQGPRKFLSTCKGRLLQQLAVSGVLHAVVVNRDVSVA